MKDMLGRTLNQMSNGFRRVRGESQTDARDGYAGAETVRHRSDLTLLDVPAALVTELRLLVPHRTARVGDRRRMIKRRDHAQRLLPSMRSGRRGRSCRGVLVPLTEHQSPTAIRAPGRTHLTRWLTARKVRSAAHIATAAANARHHRPRT